MELHNHLQLWRVHINYLSQVLHIHIQNVVIHLRRSIMERCPATGIPIIITNPDCMITALLDYCSRVYCFTLDELQNSLELATLTSVQELYLWILLFRHRISIDRVFQAQYYA